MDGIHFDLFSFWLGFIFASLCWWLVIKYKKYLPKIGIPSKQPDVIVQSNQAHQQMPVEKFLYHHTYQKILGLHITKDLFSLEEIVITPRLLVPAYLTQNDEAYAFSTIATRLIPFLPDTPELASHYFTSTVSPAESLQNGANIVVIGEPGCGKTITLAYAALEIIKAGPFSNPITNHLPYYLHVSDLDLSKSFSANPIGLIIDHILSQHSTIIRSRIPDTILQTAQEGTFLLLLDGLDEMPKSQFDKAVDFINAILKQFPKIQIMTTASPNYLGGLVKSGFHPLPVCSWNERDLDQFIEKWNNLWLTYINHATFYNKTLDVLDPRVVMNWISSQYMNMTPLEWTLKLWGLYSGDLNGPLAINALDNYLTRVSDTVIPRVILEHLALEFIRSNSLTLSLPQVEHFVINFTPSLSISQADQKLSGDEDITSLPIRQNIYNKDIVVTPKTIHLLIDNGLLIPCNQNMVRLNNPLITGFLSSFAVIDENLSKIDNPLYWSSTITMLKYRAVQNQSISWINNHILETDKPPLHRNMIILGKWISDIPVSSEWRVELLRKIFSLIISDKNTYPLKARLLSLFIASNDQNISKLNKQLLSASDLLKMLGALSTGAVLDKKNIKEIKELFGDPSQELRNSASQALGIISLTSHIDPLAEVLMNGDEQMQQGAAEILSLSPNHGYEILKEAVGYEDLSVRKASIFGLFRIQEPWAKELLLKISYDDKQWMVRNTAHQYAELSKQPNPFSPQPIPPTTDAQWLNEYASKNGLGIVAGDNSRELLINCLNDGSVEDKIKALNYLAMTPDYEVIYEIYKLLDVGDLTLSEASINALWMIQSSGVELPDSKVQ